MSKIRFLMIGGFLGAGKTTTIAAVARRFQAQGKRVGLVTNDQAYDLVDTRSLQSQGFDVGEVPGACFCCRFDDLVGTITQLDGEHHPDIIIAEPVGSCTDLMATVIEPMRHLYGDRFELGPLAVLLKPEHGLKILAGESRRGFSPQAEYIFLKQLEEGDILVVNKIDKLKDEQRKSLTQAIQDRFENRPILECSMREEIGLDELMDALETIPAAHRQFMDVDYQTYAEGEAELGWLNCQVKLSSPNNEKQPMDNVVLQLVNRLAESLIANDIEPAHLKVMAQSGLDAAVANLVASEDHAEISMASEISAAEIEMTINARVASLPEDLQTIIERTVQEEALRLAMNCQIDGMQCFQPAPPVPTHRMSTSDFESTDDFDQTGDTDE